MVAALGYGWHPLHHARLLSDMSSLNRWVSWNISRSGCVSSWLWPDATTKIPHNWYVADERLCAATIQPPCRAYAFGCRVANMMLGYLLASVFDHHLDAVLGCRVGPLCLAAVLDKGTDGARVYGRLFECTGIVF